jgi:hypothetical protein
LIEIEEKMEFRSSFNFVPERYDVSSDLRRYLVEKGFEVGVHGLKHDGKLFLSKKGFQTQAVRIRHYLKEWKSFGFVSPSTHRNLDWISELKVRHDTSTFDTDPFEPQPDGAGTIFPFWVSSNNSSNSTNPSNPITSSNPELVTRNSKSEFGCSELVTRNPKPATCNDSLTQHLTLSTHHSESHLHPPTKLDPSNSINPSNSTNPINPSNSNNCSTTAHINSTTQATQ